MVRELDVDATGKTFTRQWFRVRNLSTFRELVLPIYAGKPTVYLELGCFEGMSMLWMMQRVLTHPDSRAVGVDPWLITTKLDEATMEAVCQRAFSNLREYYPRCRLQRGNSSEVLRRMIRRGFLGIKPGVVDVCMVDGNHNALGVLDDARLVTRLVKPGGWILFDDVENDLPKADHVRQGVDLWLAEGPGAELAWKHGYMECYRRCVV